MTGSGSSEPQTFSEIQRQELERERQIRSRRPGLEQIVQPPGTYPRVPGYVWNADRGPPPPVGGD